MAQKLIIDADPGIGDALAIAVAVLDPEVDVLGITASAGCVSGKRAARNIQAIIELLDPPKRPRLGRSDAAAPILDVAADPSLVDPGRLNGATGLGDRDFQVADLHHPRESAKLMIDLVRDQPNEVTLLTLGPLTNVELACERAPEFLSLLNGLVCCAGAVHAGGNVTAAAEFNVFADPLAARHVLRSPATKTLVPLDVSRQAVLTFELVDRLASERCVQLEWLFDDLLPFALRTHHEHLGVEGIPLHELVALAAATRPHLFKSRSMAVDVEVRGELTRGMTVFDQRGINQWQTNIDVLYEAQVVGILDHFARIVCQS